MPLKVQAFYVPMAFIPYGHHFVNLRFFVCIGTHTVKLA